MAKPITSFIVAAVIVWGLVLVLHLVYTWCFQRANSLFIQKILLAFPIFFIVDNLIDYVFWKSCPWVTDKQESVRYL